ncbi:hypothetical protein EOA75_25300 [Mesorhizobium sp. M1A.F.Ca.IN.022.07.1.1]|nr:MULTISPECIES: hypothetical protein [unclassified Mesorhizobium]WIE90098.1 hypothetical protein P9270_021435 [Mesorhizobium sp. WSM4875]MDG4855252.1 hypothetical protein [Mesorhizobium sp. WSM4982]MDG4889411.1 hypothetical protein [Mesorhizobium sp. WSM4887]MDG4909679.1 hypothetical protein [Mesorhizobium sp. WSM4898]MDG4913823.1 hypothetical protein [Mesorhizobium sp. WSM4983]
MVFPGFLDPEDLVILAAALDDYCRTFRIPSDSEERLHAARHALILFENGCRDPVELSEKLKAKRK